MYVIGDLVYDDYSILKLQPMKPAFSFELYKNMKFRKNLLS